MLHFKLYDMKFMFCSRPFEAVQLKKANFAAMNKMHAYY